MAQEADGLFEVVLTTWHETTNSIYVGVREEDAVWIPKAICECWPLLGVEGSILLPEWKARELGWSKA